MKTEANVWESKSVKTRDTVEGFHPLENSHKLCQVFHQAIECMENKFYFIYKIIFHLDKEKDDIRSVYMYTLISFMKL